MKKVRLILVATIAMLFLGIGNVSAQEKIPQTVIIRTIESSKAGVINATMITVTPSGEKKVTPLLNHKWSDYDEKIGENAVIIQQEITKWQNQGFKITSTSTDGGDVYQRVFIILTKE